MLGGATVKQLIELSGQHLSIRAIARRLDISRNTVRKYLRAPGVPVAKPRPRRPSKVDPFRAQIRRRLAAGVENCVVLLRELRAQGYAGSYSILKDYVRPLRLGRAVKATMRFETKPGEQAQVDFGHFPFLHAGRPAPLVLGLRDGAGLVAAALRRVHPTRRRRQLHPLPPERLRALRRPAAHLSLRQYEGRRPGPGRRRRAALERDVSGLRPAARLRGAPVPALPRADEGAGRERRQVREAQLLAGGASSSTAWISTARRTPGWTAWPTSASTAPPASARVDRFAREAPHLLPLPSAERVAPFLREERRVGRDGFVALGARLVRRAVDLGRPARAGRRRPSTRSSSGPATSGSPCTRGRRTRATAHAARAVGRAAARRCAAPGGPARPAARRARRRGAPARGLRRARRSRPMIAAAQARHSLEQLGLGRSRRGARRSAGSRPRRSSCPYADFLADLLSTETAARRERYLRTRTRLAHLPFQRTLEQFDFRFQPSIDKRQVRELATLTFISEAANVLFLGPPGVGKTHLAVALGPARDRAGLRRLLRPGARAARGSPARPGRAPPRAPAAHLPGAQAAHHRRVRRVAL